MGGGHSGRIEITSCTYSHTGSGPASILANDLLRGPQTFPRPRPRPGPVSLVFRGGRPPPCVTRKSRCPLLRPRQR